MPCYQVQLVSVVFKVKHKSFLPLVAKELDMTYRESGRWVNIGTATIDLETGTITAYDQYACNVIKRKYSEVGIAKFAKQKGWKKFKTKQSNKFVLQKF